MKDRPTKTICFFNSNKAWGGGEKWHLTTAQEFKRRGFNTFLVTNMRSELGKKAIKEHIDSLPFYVHNLSFLNPFKILILMIMLRSKKVDAIVMNLPSDLKLAGIAAKLAGVKTIIYRRGMPHPLRNSWLNRYLFQKVLTHVVVNSQEIGRSLKNGNESWFPQEKMVLIYNGVDVTKTHPHSIEDKSATDIILGNAGRLTEQKGQKYLIEMANILKKEGIRFKIYIAGEGELKEPLLKMIRENNLEQDIKLLGHVDDMTSFFQSLDVFIFPSLYEGAANTLIETLQYGVPCIAFDVSSNPEIIQHNVNGYLAKLGDAKELAFYVTELAGSKEKREQFVTAGTQFLKEKFDHQKNLNKLQEILF